VVDQPLVERLELHELEEREVEGVEETAAAHVGGDGTEGEKRDRAVTSLSGRQIRGGGRCGEGPESHGGEYGLPSGFGDPYATNYLIRNHNPKSSAPFTLSTVFDIRAFTLATHNFCSVFYRAAQRFTAYFA